jgi:hypothetical protein
MIRPHAFVAMPFGTKPGADGKSIDFNRVHHEYIAPALDAAGLESFRADEEMRATLKPTCSRSCWSLIWWSRT